MKKKRWALIFTAGIGAAGACAKDQAPAVMTQEDKELLERVRAKEAARARLASMPSAFIKAGGFETTDRGWFKNYTKTTQIEFTNQSAFDVTDIEGKITYVRDNGEEIGSLPFKAKGELPAGARQKLNVESGEITGKATKAHLRVERVRIRG